MESCASQLPFLGIVAALIDLSNMASYIAIIQGSMSRLSRCAQTATQNDAASEDELTRLKRHAVNRLRTSTTDLYKYSPDAVPPIHVVWYHVATDKPPPPKMATSSCLFLALIYNQSQLTERKYVARYWSINTAATSVPLSTHPSSLVITTKLAAAILGGRC